MDDEPERRFRARLVTRNWALLAASSSAGFAGIGAILLGASIHDGRGPFLTLVGALAVLAAPFLGAYTWFANPRPQLRRGLVSVEPDGIAFDGRLVVRRRAIRAGFTIPHAHGVLVQLERRLRSPIEILFHREEPARALLRSLGLDASQTAVTVPLRSLATLDWRRFLPGAGLASGVLGSAICMAITRSAMLANGLALLAFAAVLFGVAMLVVKGRATIAADGVLVTHLWDRAFYPYADIARVVASDLGYKTITLVMKDGRKAMLPIPRSWSDAQERAETNRLVDRIRTAMSEQRAAPGELPLHALARRDRSVADWMVHLSGVGEGANADHRRAPIPPDRLWRIVESASHDASVRAAAAVALSSKRDAATRERLRAVASNTAAPRLRVALLAAAKAAAEEADAETEVADALAEVTSRQNTPS